MIKFVYFDVGGVTIKDFIATNKWDELVKELGLNDNKAKEFINYWEKISPRFHIGLEADIKFNEIKKKFGINIPQNYSILETGFVSKFRQNKSIWPSVKLAKQKLKIGLLTNMYPKMLKEINKKKLLPPVKWDIVIDSSKVKFQKPDEAIYLYAEKRAKVNGNEILFVENKLENLIPAEKLGWKTFLYNSAEPENSSKKLFNFIKSFINKS